MTLGTFNILIADDEKKLLNTMKTILEMQNYDITAASNGQEAWDAIQSRRRGGFFFDLLITDMQMPEVSGLELLDRMNSGNLRIPTMVTTAYGNKQIVVNLLRRGVVDYLDKPFNMAELIQRVESIKEFISNSYKAKMEHIDRKIHGVTNK